MVQTVDWADTADLHKSFELIARYVMPRFQGSLIGLEASRHDASQVTASLRALRAEQYSQAREAYEAQRSPDTTVDRAR